MLHDIYLSMIKNHFQRIGSVFRALSEKLLRQDFFAQILPF